MGSNVGHLIRSDRGGGRAAVIAGTAAALLSTGIATASYMTPTRVSAAAVSPRNPESWRYSYKPRAGGGRDPVRLDPGRSMVAGQLVPARPSLDQLTLH